MRILVTIAISNLKDPPDPLGNGIAWAESGGVIRDDLALPLDEFVDRYIKPLTDQARKKFDEIVRPIDG